MFMSPLLLLMEDLLLGRSTSVVRPFDIVLLVNVMKNLLKKSVLIKDDTFYITVFQEPFYVLCVDPKARIKWMKPETAENLPQLDFLKDTKVCVGRSKAQGEYPHQKSGYNPTVPGLIHKKGLPDYTSVTSGTTVIECLFIGRSHKHEVFYKYPFVEVLRID